MASRACRAIALIADPVFVREIVLPFPDWRAFDNIRRRAQNHVIAGLQSRTEVGAGAIVDIEIDFAKSTGRLSRSTTDQAVFKSIRANSAGTALGVRRA